MLLWDAAEDARNPKQQAATKSLRSYYWKALETIYNSSNHQQQQ
jgi:hypothetical protein